MPYAGHHHSFGSMHDAEASALARQPRVAATVHASPWPTVYAHDKLMGRKCPWPSMPSSLRARQTLPAPWARKELSLCTLAPRSALYTSTQC